MPEAGEKPANGLKNGLEMKFDELTFEMKHEMAEIIREKLLKLGIDTKVYITARPLRTGREVVSVQTEAFNSTPVIYKEITVIGIGSIEPVDGHDGVYELTFCLDYRFKYFSGGENGVEIGRIGFRFFENSMRVACMGLTI